MSSLQQTKIQFALLIFLFLYPFFAMQIIYASPYTDPAMQNWTNIKLQNQNWWNSLTDRQRYIVHSTNQILEAYRQRTGQVLYPSQQTALQIMNKIGANGSEYNLVLHTLNQNFKQNQAIQRGEGFIRCISSGQNWNNCY